MQLTDAEIREILLRKKREKKRRQMRRRRITVVVILLLIIGLAVGFKIYADKSSKSSANSEDTQAEQSDEEESTSNTPEIQPRGIIFLDAGHGGSDPGSQSGDRTESEDTLELALEVQACLEEQNFTVVMSRTEDVDVARADRCTMANDSNASLMISFHRNKAQGDNTGDGAEAYIPSFDTGNSRLLAENLLDALAERGFSKRTITAGEYKNETSDYDELANIKMPACLVEVGFINSDHDNELFEEYNANAEAITDAIVATYESIYESSDTVDFGESN